LVSGHTEAGRLRFGQDLPGYTARFSKGGGPEMGYRLILWWVTKSGSSAALVQMKLSNVYIVTETFKMPKSEEE